MAGTWQTRETYGRKIEESQFNQNQTDYNAKSNLAKMQTGSGIKTCIAAVFLTCSLRSIVAGDSSAHSLREMTEFVDPMNRVSDWAVADQPMAAVLYSVMYIENDVESFLAKVQVKSASDLTEKQNAEVLERIVRIMKARAIARSVEASYSPTLPANLAKQVSTIDGILTPVVKDDPKSLSSAELYGIIVNLGSMKKFGQQ